jgi:aromatic ring-opening dioxygenase LigB subunit
VTRSAQADDAGLVFACIAPHGDLAIPEACRPEQADLAIATQAGMTELGRRFERADPDTVVVLTPHGLHIERHMAVSVAGHAAGSLEEAPAVSLDLPVDRALATAVVGELADADVPVVGASYGGNDPSEAVLPLDWGSLIPLWYLVGRRDPSVRVVVIAPARDLAPELHVRAGAAIRQAIESSGRRVALVASADQAHAHLPSGPYGFSQASEAHDQKIVTLLREGRLGALRELDPGLISAAMPDSWWQMLMLYGAIGDSWRPELISYEAPTYYGMLCAAFEAPAE